LNARISVCKKLQRRQTVRLNSAAAAAAAAAGAGAAAAAAAAFGQNTIPRQLVQNLRLVIHRGFAQVETAKTPSA
jgi:hypothetical protein